MIRQYLQLPRAVHILCLGMLINRAGTFVIPFMTIYLRRELGLSETFATSTMGVFGLGSMIAAILGGHLADHVGRRAVMLISMFGGATLLLIFNELQAPAAILTAAFVYALLADMYRPAASAMLADLVDPARRSLAFGLMYVSINLGFSIAPLVGGMIAAYSFSWLFWGDAATCTLYGLIILLAIAETLPRRKPQTPTAANHVVVAADESDGQRPAWLTIATDRSFLLFCLASLLIGAGFMQAMGTFPLYLDRLGFGPKDYGQIIAVNGLLIWTLQLPLTSLLNRFRRDRVVIAAALLTGIGFGLTPLAMTKSHFIATVIVWTLGEMMQSPYMNAIVSDMAPVRLRGRYMGVLSMCFALAMTLGIPAGGWILAHFGGDVLWRITLLMGVAAAMIYTSIRRHLLPKPVPGFPVLIDEAPLANGEAPVLERST